jgi:hypothetical protein
VTVLALTAAALVVAVRPLRSRRLAALAAVSLLSSGAVLATYASIPVQNIGRQTQNYLLIDLLPVGLLAWLATGSAVVLTARRVIHPARVQARVRGEHGEPGSTGGTAARWAVRASGFAAIALIGLGSWLAVVQQALASARATPAREVSATRLATQYIERLLPPQRLALSVANSSGVSQRDLTLGVAWALHADGYQPAVNRRAARYLGPRYLFRGRPMPHVTVVIRHRDTSVQVIISGGTPQR